MRRSLGLIALLLSCAPSEGAVFLDGASTEGSTSTSTAGAPSDDASSGWMGCGDVGVVEGDDPRFDHACGEDCDTDWCACESCTMLVGPLGTLPAGAYALRVQGGASGDGTFDLRIEAEAGAVLAADAWTRNGLFDDTIDFEVGEDCTRVELALELQTDVCSRIYEIEVIPR